MTNTRIYRIVVNNGDTAQSEHLVEASSPAQALRHVTKSMATCEVATTKEVAAMVSAGTKVESA